MLELLSGAPHNVNGQLDRLLVLTVELLRCSAIADDQVRQDVQCQNAISRIRHQHQTVSVAPIQFVGVVHEVQGCPGAVEELLATRLLDLGFPGLMGDASGHAILINKNSMNKQMSNR